jgi:hypothetical protein
MKVGIIIEKDEEREVNKMCVLMGYGEDDVCKYMVFEIYREIRNEGVIDDEFKDDVL